MQMVLGDPCEMGSFDPQRGHDPQVETPAVDPVIPALQGYFAANTSCSELRNLVAMSWPETPSEPSSQISVSCILSTQILVLVFFPECWLYYYRNSV